MDNNGEYMTSKGQASDKKEQIEKLRRLKKEGTISSKLYMELYESLINHNPINDDTNEPDEVQTTSEEQKAEKTNLNKESHSVQMEEKEGKGYMHLPYCRNCGSVVPEGTKYCPECGQAIETNTTEEKKPFYYCRYCGNRISENTVFCPNCGAQTQESSGHQDTHRTVESSVIYEQPRKKKRNPLCAVGCVISLISLLLNFGGIVGIAGTIVSAVGLSCCEKEDGNAKVAGVIGVVIGLISIIYAAYTWWKLSEAFSIL